MITMLAVVSLLAAQSPQPAAQVADSTRIERLSALGRLWYAARLFHPYLAYRPIDWDSAVVAAIPRVRAARTSDDYAAAIQSMLDALGDRATQVEHAQTPGQENPRDPDPHARWTNDSVLVISANNYADLDDWSRGIARCDSFATLVPHARAVLFDLRQRVPGSGQGTFLFVLGQSKLLPQLFATSLAAPGSRSRMHQGYRGDESGPSAGGYWSAWITQDGDVYSGTSGVTWRPTAFVVNDRSDVPSAALALQAGGHAVLVVEGTGSDQSLVSATRLDIGEGLTVRLRLSELVFADGTGGLPADTIIEPSAGGADRSLDAALALVRQPQAVPHHPRAALEPRSAPPPQKGYAEMAYPALPYRLLAAFRVWGTFEYFHAYKQLYDDDWTTVLKTFIPRFEAARDSLDYALTLAEMVTRTHDNHVGVGSPVLAAYWGEAQPPLLVRMIEGVPVVTGFPNDSAAGVARAAGVQIGDVIERVDGEPAATRLAWIERYRTASTPQWLRWRAVRSLLTGPESSTAVLQLRGKPAVRLPRRKAYRPQCYACRTGPMLQMLPGNVGYADLDRLPAAAVDSMFELFKGTRAIIFDMRGYPQGTAWPIAPRLAIRPAVVAARFQSPVAVNPLGMSTEEIGEQQMTLSFEQRLNPTTKPRYAGRTVMLIDERTISQAEHTGLFFEAANGTKFVGSPTSGANGDVTSFVVPGGISISFSGHDVRHADGRQLQRVGLRPDVAVKPTIAGIRAGRDEVLDAALAYLNRGRATTKR